MKEKPLYNSAIFNNNIQLLKAEYKHINIDDILSEAGIEAWELDPGNWFTQSRYDKFHSILVKHTGNKNIAREAGRYSVVYRTGNLMRQATLSLLSPSRLYEIIDKIVPTFTKASRMRVNRLSNRKYELNIEWLKDANPQKFQCQSFMGYFEAVYFVFRSKFPKIEHQKCYFKGDSVCNYIVSWDRTASEIILFTRNFLTVFGAIFLLGMALLGFKYILFTSIVLSFFFLISTIAALIYDKKDVIDVIRKQDLKPFNVLDSYNRFHTSTNTIKELSVALSKNKSIASYMKIVGDVYVTLGYSSGLIVLLDYNKKDPVFGNIYYFKGDERLSIHDIKGKQAYFVVESQKTLKKPLISNLKKIAKMWSHEISYLLNKFNFESVVYIPIIYEKALLGFIFLKNNNQTIIASDLYLLQSIASQSALSITNISFYESLRSSEKLQMDFVTAASHELLTPIQTINIATNIIKKRIDQTETTVNPDLSQGVDILDESVSKLNAVSKHILNFSKLEADLSIVDVDVEEIIASVKKECAYVNKSFRHEISFKTNDSIKRIKCDKNAFVSLLCNLIENAGKYTPYGGVINLSIDRNRAELTLTVRDNGIGISKEFHDNVFIKFFQISEDAPGSGLGLSYCQLIAKKHEGYITLNSPVFPLEPIRKGTELIVHLPSEYAIS